MQVIFNCLYQIDIKEMQALQVNLPKENHDFESYIRDLLDKIIVNPDKKGFAFDSETSEVVGLIHDILAVTDNNLEKYAEHSLAIANRLHRKEIESDKKNNLDVELLKGMLVISLIKLDDTTKKIIISKSDYNEFFDVESYTKRQGFPIKKKIYKAFVADINETNHITKVAVYDTHSVFAVYWYRNFLELKQVHTDEFNTDKVFNVIDTKILTPIKKISKSDYIELWNATIRFFRIELEFTVEKYVDDILTKHVPFDERLNMNDWGTKTKKQFDTGEFDSKFSIIAKVISKRFRNTISLTPQIDLNLKENIQNLEGTIQRYKEINGNKWVMIRSEEGYEYFKDTEIMNNG